jgi:uncharacterized protein
MAIKITDIPPEGITLTLERTFDLFEKGGPQTALQAEVTVTRRNNEGLLHVSGRVRAEPLLECSRCLERFPFPVNSAMDFDAVPAGSLNEGPEHELVSGELETEFYTGDELDLEEYAKEQVLISLPMVPLHNPDCKGLCSECGADLNKTECGHRRNAPEDFGAFSVLKDLLKKR